jgi:hypothetical protein
MGMCRFLDTEMWHLHFLSPTGPLLCERMRDSLHILIKPLAQHLPMRGNPHFFELFSPTHLTSLAPSVLGVVEIKTS